MTKKFDIPIYGGTLIVIQKKDLSSVAKKYSLEIKDDMSGFTFTDLKTDDNGFPIYVIVFRGKTEPSIIAHECLHTTTAILRDIYAKLDMDNEEPQCYLLGWIVEKVHSVVKTK